LLTSSLNPEFIDGLAWTADDQEIILGGMQLRRVSASAGKSSMANVPFVPGPATFPSIHDHLLAYVQATTNTNVWKLDLRDSTHPTGDPSLLISSTRQQAAASFSPDGSRIAFQSDRSGNWEIWACNRDGSNAVQLTHFGGAPTGTPRWAPDGKLIAFDSHPNGVSQIYVVPAEGGEPRQLTNGPEGGEVPSWSRDGKWIYYSTNHNSAANIWKLPVDGGAAQAVTRNSGIYGVESIDRKYLYFSRSAQDATIWRVPIGGGPEEEVTGAPKPFAPSHWAIVAAGIYAVDGNGDLLFYKFDQGSVTKVVHDARFLTDWSMAVSPDGREIVWAQVDENRADLMLVENFR
jgi:WD40 repeat protein